jgi:predicted ribosome quality control (RQC) complex YloA/Tae2 family protein
MKLHHLQALAERLKTFSFVTRARRVEDNVIELVVKGEGLGFRVQDNQVAVDNDEAQRRDASPILNPKSSNLNSHCSLFFDMTRGHSMVYAAPSQRPSQGYNAPFDTLLHSLVSSAKILDVSVVNNDRVLRLDFAPKSNYKNQHIALQFEFTGKNTNAILLDENDVVIEALRHIDVESSFRVIRPGVELLPLPPREVDGRWSMVDGDDIDKILLENYHKRHNQKLSQSKQNKASATKKQIKKFDRLLSKLADPDSLLNDAEKYQNMANIILANLHNIRPYDRLLEAHDFDGNNITIPLPKDTMVNRMSDHYFTLAKRAKSKAKNVHIEYENLSSKKDFYGNILHAIETAQDVRELDLLVPKRGRAQRKKEKIKEGELFWIEDFKVIVGRNSVENQQLLKMARANDIWMHVRDIPSSHVIIRTDKQNLPESVIEAAAKLCVDFSIKQPGDYDVDYTKRKFVKIQEGSHVEYDKYQTIRVRKEGVEIRN